jgi:hypothetical protein
LLEGNFLHLDRRHRDFLGDALTGAGRLGLAGFDIRATLLRWASTSSGLGNEAGNTSNAHVALAVASKSIVTGKARATTALEGLLACVCLEVALEVMASDEELVTNIALVRAVIEVGLNMGLDVFLAAKTAIATVIQTNILPILGVRARNVLGNLLTRNASVPNGGSDSSIKINLAHASSPRLGLGHRR